MDIISQPNLPQKDNKQLLEENQRLLKLILHNTNKTRKYILLGRLVSAVYLLLVLGSVIVAAITLPPLLKTAVQPYKELLGLPLSGQNGSNTINEVQQFLEDYR